MLTEITFILNLIKLYEDWMTEKIIIMCCFCSFITMIYILDGDSNFEIKTITNQFISQMNMFKLVCSYLS